MFQATSGREFEEQSQTNKMHKRREVLWADGFANKLLVNWIEGPSVEPGGLFIQEEMYVMLRAVKAAAWVLIASRQERKVKCVCALNVKVPKVRF